MRKDLDFPKSGELWLVQPRQIDWLHPSFKSLALVLAVHGSYCNIIFPGGVRAEIPDSDLIRRVET
jgi:hypothetical protein